MERKLRPRCYFDIDIGHSRAGRIVFELYDDLCPNTVNNFVKLCTGESGIGATTKNKLHYLNTNFHRVIKGFMIQGGDFSSGDGAGGESIYGGKFADENLETPHDKPFLLSMANCGPNTNGSQFFITTKPTPHLNKKHVVFGHVISGENLIESIENLPVNSNNKPIVDATIAACGELIPVRKKKTKKKNCVESSDKDKKNKKIKKRKHKEKKKKNTDNSNLEELNPNCSVRPDETPEVPKLDFLYRGNLKEDMKVKVETNSENNIEQLENKKYISKVGVDRSGRTLKGRGQLKYQYDSPRNRSVTPPHWKKDSQRVNDSDKKFIRRNSLSRTPSNDNKEIIRKRNESGEIKQIVNLKQDDRHMRSIDNIAYSSIKYDEKRKDSKERKSDYKRKISDHSTKIINEQRMNSVDSTKMHDVNKRKKSKDLITRDRSRRKSSIDSFKKDYGRNKSNESLLRKEDYRNRSNDSMSRKGDNRRKRSHDSLTRKGDLRRKRSNESFIKGTEKKRKRSSDKNSDYLRNDLSTSIKKESIKDDYNKQTTSMLFVNKNDSNKDKEILSRDTISKSKCSDDKKELKKSAFEDTRYLKDKDRQHSKLCRSPCKSPDFNKHEKIIFDYGEESDDSLVPRKIEKNKQDNKNINNALIEKVFSKKEATKDKIVNVSKKDELSKDEKYISERVVKEDQEKQVYKAKSKSPRERRDTKSPPAHLVAKWQYRRDKIMTRRSPVPRIKERLRHSPRRYSPRYSMSPLRTDRYNRSLHHKEKVLLSSKNGKLSKEKFQRGRSSSGTVDSSLSSDGSSVITDNNNRKAIDIAGQEHQSSVTNEKAAKIVENCDDTIEKTDAKISLENKEKSLETVMVIKPVEKPKVLSQWKTEDNEEEEPKQHSSILAKLRENEKQKLTQPLIQKETHVEILEKKVASPPISQSISKYRSPSVSRRKHSSSRSSSESSSSRRSSHSRRHRRSQSSNYRNRGVRYRRGGDSRRSTSRSRRGRRRYSRNHSRSYSSSKSSVMDIKRRYYSTRSRSTSSHYSRRDRKRSSYRGGGFTSRPGTRR